MPAATGSLLCGGVAMMKCPVCGMQVDPKTAPEQATVGGNTYYFCSSACKTKFDQNPSQYAKPEFATKR
jgi:P-type Cu+ transporter